MGGMGLVIALFVSLCQAGDVVRLDDVGVTYKNFHKGGRNPLFTNSTPNEELNLHLNSTLFSYFFFNSTVHSMTDYSQYRVVGLNARLGLRISRYLEIGYDHFSKHLLDTTYPYQKFPVEDSFRVDFFFYRSDEKKEGLF